MVCDLMSIDQQETQSRMGRNSGFLSSISARLPAREPGLQTPQKTVVRASYDRLFTEPPLAQGYILGQPIIPQISDQYEISLERQIAKRQMVKLNYYTKLDKNQIDVGLLIPNTQIGAYTADNFQEGHVKGLEFSYDFLPARNNLGWSGYLAYTNSIAKPTGHEQ